MTASGHFPFDKEVRSCRNAMVRYFFHLEGPKGTIKDDEGTPFETLEEAKEHAHIVAYEIGKNTEDRYLGYRLLVEGPDGRLLFTVPVGDAGKSM